jgi:hypothetical protein
MFDLEQAVKKWRQRMRAAGVKAPVPLDELESHLREDIERQTRSGLSAEQAFAAAVERIGGAGALKREFAKIGGIKRALLGKLKGIFAGAFIPLPPLNTYTASARLAMKLARIEAPRLGHNFVGTEHVLLALLKLDHGVVPNVLRRMSVDREALRKQIEMWISLFPSQKAKANLPYTPRVKRALRLAAREAKGGRRPGVGAEHIFLGLLLEGDGVAARVLRDLGLSSETARREISRESDANG